MYSRKYIRSYPASLPLPTAIHSFGGGGEEARGVSLPPDYTGVAFLPGADRRDFPEAVIDPLPTEGGEAVTDEVTGDEMVERLAEGLAPFPTLPEEMAEQPPAEQPPTEQSPTEQPPTEQPPTVMPSAMPLKEDGSVSAADVWGKDPFPWEPPGTEESATESSASDSPAADSPAADSPAIDPSARGGDSFPLITPALLRSLTLEDLLLFWMLLLLLSGEAEDQIYLLLGILLFMGR